MKPLYFAPMNSLSNNSFRRLGIIYGADLVFTELVWVDELIEGKEHIDRKLKIDNIDRTVIQVCAKDTSLIGEGIKKIKEIHPHIKEINYNMGCPQSTLSKCFVAGGILNSLEEMNKVSKIFSKACENNGIKPSIKLRLGPEPGNIIIEEYLKILSKNRINKFYIHARTLRHSYHVPAMPEKLKGLKEKFPELEIIYNGDISNYEGYTKAKEFDGVMIGRKALEDPRVFTSIKEKKPSAKINQFPIEEKKGLILKFIQIAKEDGLDLNLVKMNLNYLTREIEGGNELRKDINNTKTLEKIEEIFNH